MEQCFNKVKQEVKKNNRTRGNGHGTIFMNKQRKCWVAEIYDITRKTLTSWIKCVKNDNLSGLSAPAERKRKNKLNDTQRTGIMEWLKADSQLTLEAIRLKIKEQYNIEISKSTVHREIQKQNYSYIKPRPQHFKQDQNQVTEFKKKD